MDNIAQAGRADKRALADAPPAGGAPHASAAGMIRVRPVRGGFAFVSLRAGGWSVTDAGHRIMWPTSEADGERHPVATPPPGLGEGLERQIAEAFEAAVSTARSRP